MNTRNYDEKHTELRPVGYNYRYFVSLTNKAEIYLRALEET